MLPLAALLALLLFGASQALAKKHVHCGDVITQDTTLDRDLNNCRGDGIVIGADDITLDLNGHTVDGRGCESHNGITSVRSGVTIKNGIVQDFFTDVAAGGNLSVVRELTVRGGRICAPFGVALVAAGIENRYEKNAVSGQYTGIHIFGQDNLIKNNSVSNNSVYAILINSSSQTGARIEENSISHSVWGIDFSDTSRVHMEKNSISDTAIGIGSEGEASFNEIVGNTITNSTDAGIGLCCNDRNLIAGNSVSGGDLGISAGSQNTIENNLVTGTTEVGIAVSSDNQILNNTAVKNGQDGIHVFGARAVLDGNVANENGDDGIDVDNAQTTLTGNTANQNFDLGIEAVPGVTDGGGNRAFGNGNPLQCLNVVCE